MIVAKFKYCEDLKELSLSVDGHANSADYGRDLICTSATVLAYTLAQNIRVYVEYNPHIKAEITIDEGRSRIECKADDDQSYAEMEIVFNTIKIGFIMLMANYKDYVQVITNEQGN